MIGTEKIELKKVNNLTAAVKQNSGPARPSIMQYLVLGQGRYKKLFHGKDRGFSGIGKVGSSPWKKAG